MTTTTRQPRAVSPTALDELADLDPCGVPCLGIGVQVIHVSPPPLPGVAAGAKLVMVQRVEPPPAQGPLIWATADGRSLLFRADETTARELQAALDAGEEPTAIVEPDQVVATDLAILR